MNDQPFRPEYRQALSKVMDLCSKSEKCRSEVAMKLRGWELTGEEIDKAIGLLIREKYIDDRRYAASFVRDKFRFNKWGRVKIAYMLRQKGVDGAAIAEALEEIGEEAYRATLLSLLESKMRSVKGKNSYERKAKLAAFAQSHGFESDLAFQTANRLLKDDEESF